MSETKVIEVFGAGFPLCVEAGTSVRAVASEHDVVTIVDLRRPDELERARALGVRWVPTVAIDGAIGACCISSEIDLVRLGVSGPGRR